MNKLSMKIGFDAKRLYSNFTGLGNYSRTLLHCLVKYYPENDYFLYTPKVKPSFETAEFLNSSSYNTYIPKTFFKSFWRSFSILKQLKKDNIELYHGLSHELPVNIGKSKIKSVVTIHDLIFKVQPDSYPIVDKFFYDFKFKYSCVHANKIMAISESTKNDIVDYYNIDPAKIEVIYQACNSIFYILNKKEENQNIIRKYNIPDEYLLYVGSIIERKNLKVIVKSYKLLPHDLRIPLVIIGNGKAYKKEVKNLISQMNMEHLFIWIDNLKSTHELASIYQNAATFIYPSVYEGFGIPVIEALLSKIPVITSNTSSLPEAAGPNSLCIDPTDIVQMASGIEKTLTDSAYRKKAIHMGYQYALEKFDKRKNANKLMDCYKNILTN